MSGLRQPGARLRGTTPEGGRSPRVSGGRARVALASLLVVALGAAACGSTKTGGSGGGTTTTRPTGGCGRVSTLMSDEQSAIHSLQSGSESETTAESTITGINGQLAQADQEAGQTSILGIALEQLVSENGLLSEALDQSVPVGNLGTVFNTVDQDISNVQANCHS
jgi:hypothetical protein